MFNDNYTRLAISAQGHDDTSHIITRIDDREIFSMTDRVAQSVEHLMPCYCTVVSKPLSKAAANAAQNIGFSSLKAMTASPLQPP